MTPKLVEVALPLEAISAACRRPGDDARLVQPAVAEAQLAEDRAVEVPEVAKDGDDRVAWPGDGDTAAVGSKTSVARRFYGVVAADPDRLGRDAGRIAQEIVAHLQGLVGTDTEVTIEIRATNAKGFPDTVVKIVGENASALRFKDHGFESR